MKHLFVGNSKLAIEAFWTTKKYIEKDIALHRLEDDLFITSSPLKEGVYTDILHYFPDKESIETKILADVNMFYSNIVVIWGEISDEIFFELSSYHSEVYRKTDTDLLPEELLCFLNELDSLI